MTDAGLRLFARYAHAPNSLGYCGPADAAVLQQAACGADVPDGTVREVARRFSGAWPYQQMIGELTDLDPLSEEVGRCYWTGGELDVDTDRLGTLLLDRFGKQAGHYWAHLGPDLLEEVTATHAFHVLGVYPWTRLLPTGAPEPLHVLDSCRIRVGEVVEVGEQLTVTTDTLTWDGSRLDLAASTEEVAWHTPDGTFLADPVPGDRVALHWSFACDRLTDVDAEALLTSTQKQLDLTNPRLARS